MELYGKLNDFDGDTLHFEPNLAEVLDSADETFNGINERIDQFIEKQGLDAPPGGRYEALWQPDGERTQLAVEKSKITDIVWCIGFIPEYSWLDVPVFNGRGYPGHFRGITEYPGLYFVGLPWLHTWGSGRFSGIARDAEFLVNEIAKKKAMAAVQIA